MGIRSLKRSYGLPRTYGARNDTLNLMTLDDCLLLFYLFKASFKAWASWSGQEVFFIPHFVPSSLSIIFWAD